MVLAVLRKIGSNGLALWVGVALLLVVNAEAQTRKPKETKAPNELAQLR